MDTRAKIRVVKQFVDAALVECDGKEYVRTQEGWWGSRSAESGEVVELSGHDLTRRLDSAWRRHRLAETYADLAAAGGAK